MSLSTRLSLFAAAGCCQCLKRAKFSKNVPNAPWLWCPIMKLIFYYKFRFYTSRMIEICLYCHWLYFSSFILSFGQCDYLLRRILRVFSPLHLTWAHWIGKLGLLLALSCLLESISNLDFRLDIFKVHVFWEGHKILQNLHRIFDRYYT